jgi:thioredoxin-related protein
MNAPIKFIFFFLFSLSLYPSQTINMEFPYFAGKAYDFIIFQGGQPKRVYQGTIPSDGKFTLTIPAEYAPYTGMSRWLITGTREGGGLDMVIPGRDFSVSCLSVQPDNGNVIYTGNAENARMNDIYKKQQEIFARHDAMLQASRAFPKTDKNYPVFEQEYRNQVKAYDKLQESLKKDKSYSTEFLRIVNITMGIGTRMEESEENRARNIAGYITDELDWEALYTSGHWSTVISSWIDIHTRVLKEDNAFVADFAKISSKINRADLYTDFAGRVADFLTGQGKDDLIDGISPLVRASGKIAKYEGSLAAYNRDGAGSPAPDLVVPKEDRDEKISLKSTELTGKDYQKVLLVFYESGCGACESLLQELPAGYERMKSAGVKVISVSADKDRASFESKAKSFPWKDSYCDFEGLKGVNFRSYGVTGTPTLVLIDNKGRILKRGVSLMEMNGFLQ